MITRIISAAWTIPVMVYALPLQQFKECISADGAAKGYGTECQLDPGVYNLVEDPLYNAGFVVKRAGIWVHGTHVVSLSETTLRRASRSLHTLLWVDAPNVRVAGFLFDGNRYAFQATDAAPNEVDLSPLATNADVCCSEFRRAPYMSMVLAPSGTTVEFNEFFEGRISAISGGANTQNFYIGQNHFESYGTGAVGLNGSYGRVTGNSFSFNHREFAYNQSGGQLFLNQPSHHITVIGNDFDGGLIRLGAMWVAGIEAYGADHTISGNSIRNQTGYGIYCTGCRRVTITGRDDYGNTRVIENNTLDGVWVGNEASIPSNTDSVTADRVTSRCNRFGLSFWKNNRSTTNIRITNNSVVYRASSECIHIEAGVQVVLNSNNVCQVGCQ